jgi:hypothetical protein
MTNQWFTDYTKLAASTGVFYGYVFVLSLLLWLVLRYFRSDMRLVNMYCVYGEMQSLCNVACHDVVMTTRSVWHANWGKVT